MASAEERRLAHRSPPSAMPGGNPLDDLSMSGLDTEADLTDQLIQEAGSLDEEAILDTGLPDDYDPSGGGLGLPGGGQTGRVFRMDGTADDLATPAAGSTRIGVLPRIGKQQVAVAPKLSPPPPAEEPVPDEDGEEEDEEAAEEALDELPPEEEEDAPEPARSAVEELLDDDLMAELSEGVREVATHAAPLTPSPAAPPPEAADPQIQAAPGPCDAPPAPRLPFPPVFEGTTLPLPRALAGIEIIEPGATPGALCWVCPLDGLTDDAFFTVLRDLSGDLHLARATLLPIRGGTPRAAAMRPVIAAACPGLRVSSTHQLQYREAGDAVLFYVATRLYAHEEVCGLLLVEALKRADRVAVRRMSLFDPSLLLG